MAPYVVTLRRAWRDSGLTMGQLAARAGIHENTVVAILNGRNVRLASVRAVCEVLNVETIPVGATTSCGA